MPYFGPLPKADYDFDRLLQWVKTVELAPRAIFATSGTIGNLSVTGTLTMTPAGELKTAASGLRVEMGGTFGNIQLFSGDADEVDEARIGALAGGGGAAEQLTARFRGPARTGGASPVTAFVDLMSEAADASLPVQVVMGVGNTPTATGPPEIKLTNDFRLLLADGTVARPSVAFVNDLDTGFYSATNGAIVIASQGAEVARFNEEGISTAARGTLGYAEVTANQTNITSEVDLTSLAVTVTVGTSRRIKITGSARMTIGAASSMEWFIVDVKESTTYLGKVGDFNGTGQTESNEGGPVLTPSAGSHTYKLTARRITGTNTGTLAADSASPAYILVEDIGPA